jgi:hypothetical protein
MGMRRLEELAYKSHFLIELHGDCASPEPRGVTGYVMVVQVAAG